MRLMCIFKNQSNIFLCDRKLKEVFSKNEKVTAYESVLNLRKVKYQRGCGPYLYMSQKNSQIST